MVKSLSVVIPVYNSQDSIDKVADKLAKVLPNFVDHFELIMVEDHSRDNSWETIQQITDTYSWAHGIKLMRNYGQHNALLCGIRHAKYDIIATMDDDLQHPPEELPELLAQLDAGYDVVYGSPVKERHGVFRDLASQVTKIVLQNAMGAEAARNMSAFRVFRTQIRQAFEDYHGPYVNIDVLLTWGTAKFTSIKVRHEPRMIGESNYTFSKLVTHTFNLVTGFSTLPLRLASFIGLSLTIFGLILLFYIIVVRLLILQVEAIEGFTFLATAITIFAGAQMFMLGIIGEYLARMHFRMMDKPPYIVDSKIGADEASVELKQKETLPS